MEWIKCSDRLPEFNGHPYNAYLVSIHADGFDNVITAFDFVHVAFLIEQQSAKGEKMTYWAYEIDSEPIGGVTHWMPLPEPPKQ